MAASKNHMLGLENIKTCRRFDSLNVVTVTCLQFHKQNSNYDYNFISFGTEFLPEEWRESAVKKVDVASVGAWRRSSIPMARYGS